MVMMTSLVGAPCGQYGPYVFHKGFKFFKSDKYRVINLGEFFFVRISMNHDPCIGELQLLWNDQNSGQRLSSVRLYFLPEQTPDGRLSTHGEDEVLVASDNVVLKLDDLVSWITDEVDWNHGLLAICQDDIQDSPDNQLQNFIASLPPRATDTEKDDLSVDVKDDDDVSSDESDHNQQQQQPQKDAQDTNDIGSSSSPAKVEEIPIKDEESTAKADAIPEKEPDPVVKSEPEDSGKSVAENPTKVHPEEDEDLIDERDEDLKVPVHNHHHHDMKATDDDGDDEDDGDDDRCCDEVRRSHSCSNSIRASSPDGGASCSSSPSKIQISAEEKSMISAKEKNDLADVIWDKDELQVMVLSYSSYCRYRSVLRRLEGITEKWLKHALVVALGGFATFGRNTHILFCRDTFDHEELAHHELNCEYLAPTLKVKRRRKKGKSAMRSTSPGSESNTSEESKDIASLKDGEQKNGLKPVPYKNEQDFLQRLYKFMKKRKTPIHRVPHLGFKQIDLFVFFSFAQKLGGYDKITGKKLWKHVYDELGGDPGSTSAATCTRRHYEKLLLPFERFMDGKEYKPKPPNRKSQKNSNKKPKEGNESSETGDKSCTATLNGKTEDTYAFTDSNHENSKDSSTLNDEPQQSGEEGLIGDENCSDEDDKPIWVIQQAVAAAREAAAASATSTNENSNDDTKQVVKPILIQKDPNESFSEKERRWNEIRKKNALARKRVRQLRPSRGGKTCSGSEKPSNSGDSSLSKSLMIKSEAPPIKAELATSATPTTDQTIPSNLKSPSTNTQQLPELRVKQEVAESSPALNKSVKKHFHEKIQTQPLAKDHDRVEVREKKVSSLPSSYTADYVSGAKMQIKNETKPSASSSEKSWCRYSTEIPPYQFAPERYPYVFDMNMLRNFIKQPYTQSKSSYPKTSPPVNNSSSSEPTTFSASDMELVDGKPNLSQRRPSVIQHTEHVTTPSPSQSPKQMNSDVFSDTTSKDSVCSGSIKIPIPPTTMNHLQTASMMNKTFPEWLGKGGIPEAVACKTPTTSVDKQHELHEKVMMPSTCKALPATVSKASMYMSRGKIEIPNYTPTSSSKLSSREKVTNYRPMNIEPTKRSSVNYTVTNSSPVKANTLYQKTFHPTTNMTNSLNLYYNNKQSMVKQEQQSYADINKSYSEPLYNQPKRQRVQQSVASSSSIATRPSLLPFNRQQTYRTSPLSDIPKTTLTAHSDCGSEVLDLSVKKKTFEKPIKPVVYNNVAPIVHSNEEPVLDLSMKKKKPNSVMNHPSPIENITPPLPSSPKSIPNHHLSQINHQKPLKPLPTLIALQDLMKEEAKHRLMPNNSTVSSSSGKSLTSTVSSMSTLTKPNPVMFHGSSSQSSSSSKVKPNFVSIPPTFTKEMAESLYLQADPTHFPPYVIPPYYPATGWPTESGLPSGSSPSSSSSSSSTKTSLNNFKEAMSNSSSTSSVFPKQYLHNYKLQFHPMLCKDNGYYPPSCK